MYLEEFLSRAWWYHHNHWTNRRSWEIKVNKTRIWKDWVVKCSHPTKSCRYGLKMVLMTDTDTLDLNWIILTQSFDIAQEWHWLGAAADFSQFHTFCLSNSLNNWTLNWTDYCCWMKMMNWLTDWTWRTEYLTSAGYLGSKGGLKGLIHSYRNHGTLWKSYVLTQWMILPIWSIPW